jgi:GTP-binding protein
VKVSSVRFVKSAQKQADFPRDHLTEIAFTGRSNVGKSRLLNTLVGIRSLARISSTPGRTQTINFFLVGQDAHFVDLPGYGYAKAPKRIREGWQPMVESYLRNRPQLRLVLLLIDCRIPPTRNDVLMQQWLNHYEIQHVIVLTKADKLSRSRLKESVRTAREALGVEDVIPFSAVTGLGKNSILARIQTTISQAEATHSN